VRTLRLILAYDGTAFAGWQSQRGQRTVQGVLHAAVAQVAGHEPKTLASSRTDAGVHALGQVVGVRVETRLAADVLQRALNANLPPDVCVREVCDVPATFHPLRDAVRKHYRYAIHDGPTADVFARHFCWRYACGRLDVAAMRRAAAALCGTHDFRSFATSGSPRKTTVRTIERLAIERSSGTWQMADGRSQMADGSTGAEGAFSRDAQRSEQGLQISDFRFQISDSHKAATGGRAAREPQLSDADPATALPDSRMRASNLPSQPADIAAEPAAAQGRAGQGRVGGDFVLFDIVGNGFLYNMVRTIVGTLVPVGRDQRPETWPGEVLRAADRRAAGRTAPPQGLCLVQVELREPQENCKV